jgi:YD repeat-containing protein
MKSFSRLFFFFVLFLPLFTRADAFSLMEISEWMESIQLIEGEWIEGATDLATENLQLSRLFTTVERSNRRLAEGWQFNLPGLLEQDMPRRPFLHPLKKHIKLRYDEKNRLVKLETEAPLPYESIEIFYEEGNTPCCRALSHLGDLVEYAMESSEGNNLCLSSVKKSGSPEIRYRYKKHPTERKLLLTERTVEGVETLLFEYTKDGKLRSVYRNSKDHLLFSLEYLQQKTRVSFPSGVVQEYSFNASKHVTRIDTIVSSSLYKTQTFEWKNGKISEKATLDGEGKTLIKESFDFDSQGHLIRESIAGINSDPYSKEYAYDAEDRLIEEREASGKNKRYIYTGSSQAASEIHVLNGDEQLSVLFILIHRSARLHWSCMTTARELLHLFKTYHNSMKMDA